MIAVCAVAERASAWIGDSQRAVQYGVDSVRGWRKDRQDKDDNERLVRLIVERCEPLFGVNKLRLLEAHVHPNIEGRVGEILKEYFRLQPPRDEYRAAIIQVYERTERCMEFLASSAFREVP
jgi:hypothetical protein